MSILEMEELDDLSNQEHYEIEGTIVKIASTADEIDKKILIEYNTETMALENDLNLLASCFEEFAKLMQLQGDNLTQVQVHVQNTEQNVEDSIIELQQAEQMERPRGWVVKGVLAFSGVTVSGVGLLFLNPIAGVMTAGIGVTGLASVIGFAAKKGVLKKKEK